jgi:UDP:flavonoid glycosyltransferase YjiC (YdhE family)
MKKTLKEKFRGVKVLVATIAYDGHFNPLTGIAKYLQDAGCDIRWYTSSVFKKKLLSLNIPHYPMINARDVNATNLDEVYPERKLIADAGERLNFDMINGFCKKAPGNFEDIQLIGREFPFDVIITDSMFPAIPLLKSKLNVPVIAIGVIPLAAESVDLGPYGLGLCPTNDQEQLNMYSAMKIKFNTVVFKEAIDAYCALLEENNIPYERSTIPDILIKHADLYLQIGTPSFEYKRSDLGSNIRFIGALLPYSNGEDQLPWSDERLTQYERIILVTQGTLERDPQKIIEPTLEAFKNTDVLVVATTGGHATKALRKKYPFTNMIIEDYIPFDAIMPYASVYVTNGGYGGTLLSIEHHLPIVAAGLHEGKNEICARIGHFKYGINLKTETPEPGAILEAVNMILADKTYRSNIVKLSDELRRYHAQELVAQHVMELIETRR